MPKVYEGGLPGSYSAEMGNAGFGISGEGEITGVPGKAEAKRPSAVKEGGATQGKTYSESQSEGFLMDSNYKTNLEVGRPKSAKTVNPDAISHEDNS